MGKNPNIGITFSQNRFAQEVNQMASALKTVKKEFEVTNSAIELTGNKLDIAKAKIQGFGKQVELQRALTNKLKEGLESAASVQQKLADRVEKARIAYENAAKSEGRSAEEVKKLKKEYDDLAARLSKADKTVNNWNNKLLDSKKAENQLAMAIKQTNTDLDKQNKEFAENAKNARNVTTASGQLLNAYNLIKGLAIGYAGKTLYDALIGGNAKFEQYMTSFEVLLGGADKADKRMKELTQFAAKTPFELPDLVEAEKRLLAYGVAVKDTAKILPVLGDISMGNAEKLNMISLAYGQVVTNQRLYGTELRQFAENGVPLLAELAKMYGVTEAKMREMVEDGVVGADAVTAALESMTSAGGKFYGMMDKQSQTFNGMMSTLRDNFGMFAREVGGEAFEELKTQLQLLMAELNLMADNGQLSATAEAWGKSIASAVESIIDFIKWLYEMRNVIIGGVEAFIAFKVAMSIGGVIMAVVDAVTTFNKAMQAGVTVTTALNAAMAVNPWVLLGSVIAAAVIGITGYNLATKDAANETSKAIKEMQDLTETYERTKNSINDTTDAKLAQLSVSKQLIPELETLSQKTNRTEAENSRLNFIVDQLNRAMPDLALAIDNETGALNRQIGVVYDAVTAYQALAKAKAAQDMLYEAEKNKLKAQQVVDKEKQKGETPGYMSNGAFVATMGDNSFNSASREAKKVIDEAEQEAKYWAKKSEEYQAEFDKYKPKQVSGGGGGRKTTPPLLAPKESKSGKSDAEREAEEAKRKAEEYRKGLVDTYKKTVDEREHLSQRWISTEEEHGRLETEGKRDAYGRMAEYYRAYANEVLDLSYMTEEEKAEIHKQYIEKAEDYDLEYFKLYKQMVNERLQESKKYIDERNYYNDWGADNEIASWERIKAYLKEYLDSGILSWQEYADKVNEINKSIRTVEQNTFKDRRQDSEEWISEQKFYGNMTAEQEIAAYERVKKYVTQYYEQGLIDFKDYNSEIKKLDQNIFSVRKQLLEDYVKNVDDSSKSNYEIRKKAIEDEYALIDRSEKQKDRAEKLKELMAQEKLYRNAVTVEGKDRLKQIKDEIKDLNRESDKEKRELEKENRLEKLQKEYEEMDNKQKSLLQNISKYASLTAGTIETMTDKIAAMLDIINKFNVGDALSLGRGPISQNTYNTINQKNSPIIYDKVSADIWGSYMSPKFK